MKLFWHFVFLSLDVLAILMIIYLTSGAVDLVQQIIKLVR